jgi:hypothetical protein
LEIGRYGVEKIRNFTLISVQKLEPKEDDFLGTSQKNRVLWLQLLNGARYKDKKPHFKISVKLRIFLNPISTIC